MSDILVRGGTLVDGTGRGCAGPPEATGRPWWPAPSSRSMAR